ncbi:MAG: hypothetical protein QGH74_00610 [Candidatus Brocadiia bacterium]|jgi:hypothetical protein|nr:hypothetical protein [Candidatus Brocadiia bacterium]
MAEGAQCSKCEQPLSPETTVRLWDGKDYCDSCVEAACPGMADYAREPPVLSEHLDPGPPPGAAQFVFDSVVVVLCLPLLLVGFGGLAGVAWLIHPVLVVLVLLLFVLALLGVVGKMARFEHRKLLRIRPTISVQEGVCQAESAGSSLWQADLPSCGWEEGRARWDFVIGSLGIVRHVRYPVILLAPCGPEWDAVEAPIACGWTPEMRALWIGFLTLAGVPSKEAP